MIIRQILLKTDSKESFGGIDTDENTVCKFMGNYVESSSSDNEEAILYLKNLVSEHEVFSDLKVLFDIIPNSEKLLDYLVLINEIYKKRGHSMISENLGDRLYTGHFFSEVPVAALLIFRDIIIRNKIIRDTIESRKRKIRAPKVRTDRAVCINLQEELKDSEYAKRIHYPLFSAYSKNFNAKKATLVTLLFKGEIQELIEMVMYSLEEEGSLIIEVDKIDNNMILSVIDMMSRCFEEVELMKPCILSTSTSTSYIVCTNFEKPIPKKERKGKDNTGSENTKNLIDKMKGKTTNDENPVCEFICKSIKDFNVQVANHQANVDSKTEVNHKINNFIYSIFGTS